MYEGNHCGVAGFQSLYINLEVECLSATNRRGRLFDAELSSTLVMTRIVDVLAT